MHQVITTDWDGTLILVDADFDEAGALRYSAQFTSYGRPENV
jgi:hypothetical protein